MKKVIALAFIAISLNASAQTDSTKSHKRPIDKVKVWQNGVVYDAGINLNTLSAGGTAYIIIPFTQSYIIK